MPAPKKILVLASMALGDTVMFMPVLRTMRETYPHAKFDIVLEHKLPEQSLRKTGYCNHVYVIDNGLFSLRNLTRFSSLLHFIPVLLGTSFRFLRILALTAFRYDLVVGHYNSCLPDLALLALISGARVRIGQIRARKNNALYRHMYTQHVPFSESNHLLASNFELLNHLGMPTPSIHSFWPLFERDLDWARNKLIGYGIVPNRFVVICPSVGYFKWKQWPLDSFECLIRKILEATTYHIVLVGGNPGKRSPFSPSSRVIDLDGKTSVDQTAALLSFSALVIANDSGIAHMSAALGKPVLTIFGPTDPNLVGPWEQLENVVRAPELACLPCFVADDSGKARRCRKRNCLVELSVETVFERFVKMDASNNVS